MEKITENKYSIETIEATLIRVKNRLKNNAKFEDFILATTKYWEVFDHIDNLKDINVLIQWFRYKLPKKVIPKIFKQENECKENLLHYLSRRNDLPELLKFLHTAIAMSQFTKNVDKKINFEDFVTAENEDGLNFLHIICSKKLKEFEELEKILNWIIESFGLKTLEYLLCKVTREGNNFVLIISRYQSALFFIQNFYWMASKMYNKTQDLLTHRNNDGKNCLQMAAKKNHKKMKKIVKPVHDKFGSFFLLDNMLCSTNNENQTLGHILVSSNPDSFYELLNFKDLNEELVRNILVTPGKNNETVIDKICKDLNVFKKTFTLLKEKHNIEFVKKLLSSVDKRGNTFLMRIIKYDKIEDILEVLNWMLTEYKQEFIQDLIQIKNKLGYHLIYQIQKISYFKSLLKWMMEKISKEFALNLIKQQNDDGDTFLHHVSEIYRIDLSRLVRSLYELFDVKELKELFLCKNGFKESCLHLWSRHRKQNQLIKLFDVFVKYDKSCFLQLLASKDEKNRTFLHALYSGKQNENFEELLKNLIKHLTRNDTDFLKNLLLSKNAILETFLYNFIHNNDFNELKTLISLSESQFGKGFVQELLSSKGVFETSFLGILLLEKGSEDFEKIIELIVSQFGKDFSQEFLTNQHNYGTTLLRNLARKENVADFEKYIKLLVCQFGKNFVQGYLINKDCDTFLTSLDWKDSLEKSEKIFQFLVSQFGKDFVQELLISKNRDGDTFLKCFAWEDSSEGLENLIKILLRYRIGKDFVQNLVFSKNNKGSTVFLTIFKFKNFDEFYQFLSTLFDEQLYNKLKEEFNS